MVKRGQKSLLEIRKVSHSTLTTSLFTVSHFPLPASRFPLRASHALNPTTPTSLLQRGTASSIAGSDTTPNQKRAILICAPSGDAWIQYSRNEASPNGENVSRT